jgi:hypothetical protein
MACCLIKDRNKTTVFVTEMILTLKAVRNDFFLLLMTIER